MTKNKFENLQKKQIFGIIIKLILISNLEQ